MKEIQIILTQGELYEGKNLARLIRVAKQHPTWCQTYAYRGPDYELLLGVDLPFGKSGDVLVHNICTGTPNFEEVKTIRFIVKNVQLEQRRAEVQWPIPSGREYDDDFGTERVEWVWIADVEQELKK
jgi:hypothetical protein